jgi:capsular exopolysaccharide synthesis family protein
MTARDTLTIFRRRWLLLLIATLLGVFGGYLTTLGEDEEVQTYRGTHTLTVNNDVLTPDALVPEGESSSGVTASQLAVLVDRGPVPVAAAERLNYDGEPAVLASEVDVQADDELGTIEIAHVAANPDRAARVANIFADEFLRYLRDTGEQTRRQATAEAQSEMNRIQARMGEIDAALVVIPPPPNAPTLEAERTALTNQYNVAYERFRTLATAPTVADSVQILERAEGVPVSSGLSLPDNTALRLALTGLIGLVIGCAIALALEGIDTRIRDRDQAERAFGLPVIAEIPAMPRSYRGQLVSSSDRSLPFVEAYRGLATVLALHDAHEDEEGRSAQVVCIVSPGPGEGKTASVAHVAVAFAEVGREVLVLDCDFHRPRLDQVFDVHQESGIRDALAWHQGSRLDLVRHAASTVRVAPAGRAVGDPARLLAHGPTLIDTARRDADVVLIDTPPLLAVSDAIGLTALADAVLVVCRVGRTTRSAAERTRATLDRVGAHALGVVLTAVPQRGRDYYGYYGEPRSARGRDRSRRRRGRRARKAAPDAAFPWDDFDAAVESGGTAETDDEEWTAADPVDVNTGPATPPKTDES